MKRSHSRRKLTFHAETIAHLTRIPTPWLAQVQGGRPRNSDDDNDSCSAEQGCTVTQ
ncbi:MAG TPA: hypothetical protein VFK02_35070 [Kofleriaceae bacterium]|nr:hypothetical protein [Kofleriaceae bacterium]